MQIGKSSKAKIMSDEKKQTKSKEMSVTDALINMHQSQDIDREFAFSKDEFRTLSDLVKQRAGIVLKDHKMNMVYGRLARRLRSLGIRSFADYLVYLNGVNGKVEISALINAITTNLTKFFREEHHFKHLESVVMPDLIHSGLKDKEKKIRIWSAGCSSGEEPYSISMVLDQALKKANGIKLDAKILATDLDTNMLQVGRNGFYKEVDIKAVASKYQSYFEYSPTGPEGTNMARDLRQLISFKELNLLEDWPMKGSFDAIFCRNVMIYFDNETKRKLTERFCEMLKPGGWFYVGHSETLLGVDSLFKLHGRTIYRRPV